MRNQMLRKMHALLRELNLVATKDAILSGYGVDSAADLSDEELFTIVDKLVNIKNQQKHATDVVLRKKRSEILVLLEQLNVYNRSNWEQVNNFLTDKRIAGKKLYELNEDEMNSLSRKLRAMIDKRIRKISEENILSMLN